MKCIGIIAGSVKHWHIISDLDLTKTKDLTFKDLIMNRALQFNHVVVVL